VSSKESAINSLEGLLTWEQQLCNVLNSQPPKPLTKGENMNYIESKIDLLEKSKNLILTGAPGTGKTYLARQMAMKMIAGKIEKKDLSSEEEAKFKNQCRFVQFHPSYDYTDFVEGLRPTRPDEKGNIGFELKNGIFKKFCKDALAAWADEKNKVLVEKRRKFIFIIDEISRGEISKIFGELFFSIDPGYRGKRGGVQTQYANIQSNETETIFDTGEGQGWFYVPENVYIIGTMNDIDRSVESFDFAMRRRFVWEEITADDTAASMGLSQENINRLKALNEAIEKIEGLGSSYHIGGSYFLQKQNDKPVQLDCADVWKFRLKPLLREYLRGMPDAKTHLGALHKAFDPAYSGGPEE
jgi:5-methylcytosine-specific restriction endonuclease McrBC GTP-binding regulatory subunit McrB